MKPEDRLLFLCARQDFSRDHLNALIDLCAANSIAWDRVFVTAQKHRVAPLVWTNLENAISLGLVLAPDIIRKFQFSCYRNARIKGKRATNLANALALLNAHSIEVMALKGTALDLLVYEQPWYTIADDTDLLLRPRQQDLPPSAMAAINLHFQGLGVEYEFFDHHDVTMSGALPVDFDRIWRDARCISFQGHNLFLMSPEDMLLSICINNARKRYFRLRSLVDIAETVNRCPGLDWALLAEKAQAYECNHIAYTALLVTQVTLGCNLPEGALDRFAVGRTKAAFLRLLVAILLERLSLASLSPYTGWGGFGRRMGWSLILPYAAERRSRIGQRIQAAYQAWRLGEP